MSAIVTILYAEKEKSIQMNLNPGETIEEIIHKCEDYWLLDRNPGGQNEHVLLRGNETLAPEETVISSDIQDGDVLKFMRRSEYIPPPPPESEDGAVKLRKRELTERARDWLEQNIGLDPEKMELVGGDRAGGERCRELTLVFKEAEGEDYFTVQLKDGKVVKYIPTKMEMDSVE
ncbi:MAG: hypothetical protein ACOCTR_04905 [Candidatus Natronoplasma sp.]